MLVLLYNLRNYVSHCMYVWACVRVCVFVSVWMRVMCIWICLPSTCVTNGKRQLTKILSRERERDKDLESETNS